MSFSCVLHISCQNGFSYFNDVTGTYLYAKLPKEPSFVDFTSEKATCDECLGNIFVFVVIFEVIDVVIFGAQLSGMSEADGGGLAAGS